MLNRTLRRVVLPAAALALLAASQTACEPAPSTLRVTCQEDALGLTSRLVFSTRQGAVTGPRAATLANVGSTPIRVSGLTIGGLNVNQFALAAGQSTSFTIAPNGSAEVGVRFTPSSNGNKFATLTVANDSSTPSYEIRLRGVNARGTLGRTEPQLSQLMQLFGYTTNVGFTTIDQATTRAPLGDEVISPYFVRVDGSQPVRLVPIARYVGANTGSGDTGRTAENSATKQSLFRFPPDDFVDLNPDPPDESIYRENQKTFPTIASGTTTFSPTSTFGIYGSISNYSDDRFNVDAEGTSFHNIRVYPAKGEGGVVLPNSWLLTIDVNTNPPDKNFDHQDLVLIMTNARPALSPGPSAVLLSFNSPIGGTLPDKDGEGTGFTSIQPNRNGTQSQPSRLDVTGGRLRITSTAGQSGGAENLQVNALQAGFDGSRTDKTMQARVLGPLTDLTSGFQQKAVFWGPDQDNYLKVEAEHRPSPAGVYITVFREQNGQTATIGQVAIVDPASVSTLDLSIVGDLEPGLLQGRYRINGGTWTNLGTTFRPVSVMRFFSPQARAGVLVSHTGSSTPIVGVYDSFAVT